MNTDRDGQLCDEIVKHGIMFLMCTVVCNQMKPNRNYPVDSPDRIDSIIFGRVNRFFPALLSTCVHSSVLNAAACLLVIASSDSTAFMSFVHCQMKYVL